MKLPVINGEEILPIRLIPTITANQISEKVIAGILARLLSSFGFALDSGIEQEHGDEHGMYAEERESGNSVSEFRKVELFAYHLNEEEAPVKLLPVEWDRIYKGIILCNQRKKEICSEPDCMESTSIFDAINILPSGVFLWRKDFEDFWRARNEYIPSNALVRDDFEILNFDAYIAPKDRDLIWEGFEAIRMTQSNIDPKPEPIDYEKYVEELLEIYKSKEIVAVILKHEHHQQLGKIARLLSNPNHSSNASNDAWKQRGRQLVNKGIEILKEQDHLCVTIIHKFPSISHVVRN